MKPYSARVTIQYGCPHCEVYYLKGALSPEAIGLRPVCPICGSYVCSAGAARKWFSLYGGKVVGEGVDPHVWGEACHGGGSEPHRHVIGAAKRKAPLP